MTLVNLCILVSIFSMCLEQLLTSCSPIFLLFWMLSDRIWNSNLAVSNLTWFLLALRISILSLFMVLTYSSYLSESSFILLIKSFLSLVRSSNSSSNLRFSDFEWTSWDLSPSIILLRSLSLLRLASWSLSSLDSSSLFLIRLAFIALVSLWISPLRTSYSFSLCNNCSLSLSNLVSSSLSFSFKSLS